MNNRQDEENPFGSSSGSSSPFGASGNDSPFGASGNDSPFGSSGNESPFGASGNDNPFGAAPAADPFAIANAFDEQPQQQQPAHVVPNPFGALPAPAVEDPFAIGNHNDAQPAHVVPNPFGGFGAAAAAAAPVDPFAIGNNNHNDAAHVVPNPFGGFGAAAPAPQDPFAFGNGNNANNNNEQQEPQPAHVVANPFGGFGFGGGAQEQVVANPFGIANDGPVQDDLDLSQHSIGETFLQVHMNRLSEQTSMRLSQEEQRWAQELQAAVQASKDISQLSDMEIAQQALTHQGNVYNALLSIKALQEFRRTHAITDTTQDALTAIAALLDQQEGTFLDVETNPQTQESALVIDLQAFQPAKALEIVPGKPADHSWKVLARGIYYLHKATQPSLASVRHGLFLVVDCDGVGWDNFNSEVDQRLHAELLQHLPVHWKKIMAYSTALVASVWWGLTKRLFSSQFIAKLEKGCRLVDTDPSRPPRRIAEMYRQPDLKTVQEKLQRRAQELFVTRETNEEEFTLQTTRPIQQS